MLSSSVRAQVSKVTTPIAKFLIHCGLTANSLTIVGTVLTIVTAVVLFPSGHLFSATMLIWFFVMFDMLDGAMARIQNKVTSYGAVLDSSCDRLADGAICGSLAWWSGYSYHTPWLVAVLLAVGVLSQTVSYIKARAQSCGIEVEGGLFERTERLIVMLAGSGLEGLHVPHALEVSAVILLVGVLLTVFQRLQMVSRADSAVHVQDN